MSLVVFAEQPTPLAGTEYPPDDTDWRELHERGFRLVVRLHRGDDYDPAPLSVRDIQLEDLYGGAAPTDPAAEAGRIRQAALIAADAVERGDGVIVHCLGGTGRTGTVVACALCLLGRSAEEAIETVQAHRPRWPESPWQEEFVRSG